MPRLNKDEFSTDFLWRLVADAKKFVMHRSVEIEVLFQTLFPGIRLSYANRYEVLRSHCIPALYKQFPKLRNSQSLEIAVKQYGKTMKVAEERKCDGYEWVNWELNQSC